SSRHPAIETHTAQETQGGDAYRPVGRLAQGPGQPRETEAQVPPRQADTGEEEGSVGANHVFVPRVRRVAGERPRVRGALLLEPPAVRRHQAAGDTALDERAGQVNEVAAPDEDTAVPIQVVDDVQALIEAAEAVERLPAADDNGQGVDETLGEEADERAR